MILKSQDFNGIIEDMINPIKSLYYQYFWWQRKQSGPYQDIAQWSALSFLVISIELYQLPIIYRLLELLIKGSEYFYLEEDINTSLMVVHAIILGCYLLNKKNWKRIVRNKKYNTMPQKILAILFPIFGLACMILLLKL